MNRQQKIAWYSIAALSAVLLLTAAMTCLLVAKFGWRILPSSLCFLGLSCIAGLGPLIFRKDKTQPVPSDERDYLLELHASNAGFAACYCYFVIVGMAILISHGFTGVIPINWLISFLVGGYVATEFVRAVAILTQYGWTKKASS